MLAVLLPVIVVGLLATAGTEPVEPEPRPPATIELTSATLGCPTGLPGAQGIRVASAGEAAGEVSIGEEQATLEAGRSLQVGRAGSAVVRAGGDLAPGLVAGRSGTTPLVATDCPRPVAEQWFTGVGAGARHSSVLELVNPNTGPAVADVVVLGGAGAVDAPQLRGVLVPGGATRRLELATLLPQEGELALQVSTTRGRLTASVEDTEDRLGSAEPVTDWLGGSVRAAGDQHAPRAAVRTGSAQPGAREPRRRRAPRRAADRHRRLGLRPCQGLDEVRIAPRSTTRVPLSNQLQGAMADGAYGVQIDATGPVTASLRSVVRRDVSHAVPADPVSGRTVAVVPEGRKQLSWPAPPAVGAGRRGRAGRRRPRGRAGEGRGDPERAARSTCRRAPSSSR